MAKAKLTKTANIIAAREADFVSRFTNNWQELRDILGVHRLVKKTPGTILKSKYAEVSLQNGAIGEGESILFLGDFHGFLAADASSIQKFVVISDFHITVTTFVDGSADAGHVDCGLLNHFGLRFWSIINFA